MVPCCHRAPMPSLSGASDLLLQHDRIGQANYFSATAISRTAPSLPTECLIYIRMALAQFR